MVVWQRCLKTIDSGKVTLEDLRKVRDPRVAYPDLLIVNLTPDMWVADL